MGSLARSETLQQAVELTLKTSPDVLIEVAKREQTTQALSQAKGGYLPKIDMASGSGRERKDNATVQSSYGSAINQKKQERSLTLTQMLFDGFATASEVARNQARLDSADHKVAATSEQTALKAVENFLEVLRLTEILNLTKENLVAHQRTYDQIKVRVSGGMARKSDLDQIEARMALAGSNLTAAEANLDVAAINYKLVVGAMPGDLTKPKPPSDELIPTSPEEAVFFATENSRFLKSAGADVEAAKAQQRAAKAGLYPRLDLEMGRSDSYTSNSFDSQKDLTNYLMFRMRYNLFRGGADSGRISETHQQTREAQEVRNRAERQLEQSVRLAWSAHRAARDRLPNLRKHAESSLATREAYQKQFSLGQRTLLDLLDTENEYFTATSNNINGYYVELFSRYRLLAELNQLLAIIGVSPEAIHRDGDSLPQVPTNNTTDAMAGFKVLLPESSDKGPTSPEAQAPVKQPDAATPTPAPADQPPTEQSPNAATQEQLNPWMQADPAEKNKQSSSKQPPSTADQEQPNLWMQAAPTETPKKPPGKKSGKQPPAKRPSDAAPTDQQNPWLQAAPAETAKAAPPLTSETPNVPAAKPTVTAPAPTTPVAKPAVEPGASPTQPVAPAPTAPAPEVQAPASPTPSESRAQSAVPTPSISPAGPAAADEFMEASPDMVFDGKASAAPSTPDKATLVPVKPSPLRMPTPAVPVKPDSEFMDAPSEMIYETAKPASSPHPVESLHPIQDSQPPLPTATTSTAPKPTAPAIEAPPTTHARAEQAPAVVESDPKPEPAAPVALPPPAAPVEAVAPPASTPPAAPIEPVSTPEQAVPGKPLESPPAVKNTVVEKPSTDAPAPQPEPAPVAMAKEAPQLAKADEAPTVIKAEPKVEATAPTPPSAMVEPAPTPEQATPAKPLESPPVAKNEVQQKPSADVPAPQPEPAPVAMAKEAPQLAKPDEAPAVIKTEPKIETAAPTPPAAMVEPAPSPEQAAPTTPLDSPALAEQEKPATGTSPPAIAPTPLAAAPATEPRPATEPPPASREPVAATETTPELPSKERQASEAETATATTDQHPAKAPAPIIVARAQPLSVEPKIPLGAMRSETALAAVPQERQQADGVDWGERQFWLVEIEGQFDRVALAATWKTLQSRFAAQLEDKTLVLRRHDGKDGSAVGYRLFIARFANPSTANALCVSLMAEQIKCSIAPASSLTTPQPAPDAPTGDAEKPSDGNAETRPQAGG